MELTENEIMQAHHDAFLATNLECGKQLFDSQLSGTTAITVMVRQNVMFVNNVGDSRAVVAVRKDGKLLAEHLSIDQTPFRKDERERVKKCGAIIMTIDQIEGLEPIHENWGINLGEEVDESGDPPRVWEKNMQRPGCAFTRSIGDAVAENVGVFAEPEPLIRCIDPHTAFVVIASDGVWEFLTSQTVVDMVDKFSGDNAPLNACKSITAESYRLWLQYEVRTDDITIVVLRIDDFQMKGARAKQDSNTSNGSPNSSTSQRRTFANDSMLTQNNAATGHVQRPVRRMMSKAKRRVIAEKSNSITNEALDKFVLEEHIQPKTDEERAAIEKHIQANFLFQHMTPKQKMDTISCMEKISVNAGDIIMKQGDHGDKFYVVESGTFDVSVRDEDGIMRTVLTYDHAGSAFGELSLMYGKPRAATVTATSPGQLWAINRIAFRSCMMKRNTHVDLISVLKKVEILKPLAITQMQRMCDCLAEEEYEAGAYVIKQGETGERMYIVESGELVVTQGSAEDGTETEVLRLKKNDYFGERALMYSEARAANVVALDHVKLLTLSRQGFEEVVGDLHTIIAKDQEKRERKTTKRMTTYSRGDSEEVAALRGSTRDMFQVRLAHNYGGGSFAIDTCAFGTLALIKGGSPTLYGMKVFNKLGAYESGGYEGFERERKMLSELKGRSRFLPSLLATFQTDRCCFSVYKSPLVTVSFITFRLPALSLYRRRRCCCLQLTRKKKKKKQTNKQSRTYPSC